jgi:hypothetical protein
MKATPSPTDPVDSNRQDLIAIVGSLFLLIGLEEDGSGSVGRIARAVRAAVLRTLRPAESAVRRLIYVVAQGLSYKPSVVRPFPAGGIVAKGGQPAKPRKPAFKLEDPQAPVLPALDPDPPGFRTRLAHLAAMRGPDPTVPAIWADIRARAKLSENNARAAARAQTRWEDFLDDSTDPAKLLLRLQAISYALSDLPKQARRLARWTERRKRLDHLVRTTPFNVPPMLEKPERAPKIALILEHCHALALRAQQAGLDRLRTSPVDVTAPDTS